MINGIKIFDCTLREAGYQTGWFFTKKTVQDIYKFALGKGIDYVELGFFHNPQADPDRGDFRYCSIKNAEIIDYFKNIKNITKISAMRDIQRPMTDLLPANESIIDTIRILVRSPSVDFDDLGRYATEALGLGYEVFINFTSAGYNTMETNKKFAEFASSLGVKSIEFADTESVMTPEYVKNTIQICHDAGLMAGCHFHDKNGTADMLADIAINSKADYLDVTHIGLGGKWRDGNLTMEFLMRRFGITAGYEATVIRNELIEDLIKYHAHTASE